MDLLFKLVLSAVLVAPARPAALGPDSGSVVFTTTQEQLGDPFLSSEDALALLLGEHRLSLPMYWIEGDSNRPAIKAAMVP